MTFQQDSAMELRASWTIFWESARVCFKNTSWVPSMSIFEKFHKIMWVIDFSIYSPGEKTVGRISWIAWNMLTLIDNISNVIINYTSTHKASINVLIWINSIACKWLSQCRDERPSDITVQFFHHPLCAKKIIFIAYELFQFFTELFLCLPPLFFGLRVNQSYII